MKVIADQHHSKIFAIPALDRRNYIHFEIHLSQKLYSEGPQLSKSAMLTRFFTCHSGSAA